jgi:hypothetical protein
MRKRIVPLILRCLIHLEKITPPGTHISSSTSRTTRSPSSSRSGGGGGGGGGARHTTTTTTTTMVPDRRSTALPADTATFEYFFTTIEEDIQFRIADDTAFTINRVLHDFDMFAFEFEQLSRHLRYSLSGFASFGIATDWHFEFACLEKTVFF